MTWTVTFNRKAQKQARKLPRREYETLFHLVRSLEESGPYLPGWPNYSKLGKDLYHCHLSRRWVACWEVRDKELRLIEITYAGSRESAPY